MKRLTLFPILLVWFVVLVIIPQQQATVFRLISIGEKPLSLLYYSPQEKLVKPTESIADSVEVYSVVWTIDSVEYEGDKNVDHGWMKPHDWLDGQSFVRDSLGQRILPKICKDCYRKVYAYEHISTIKKETEYNKLQKEMLKRKKK